MNKKIDYKKKIEDISKLLVSFNENLIFYDLIEGLKTESYISSKDYLYLKSEIEAIIKGNIDSGERK